MDAKELMGMLAGLGAKAEAAKAIDEKADKYVDKIMALQPKDVDGKGDSLDAAGFGEALVRALMIHLTNGVLNGMVSIESIPEAGRRISDATLKAVDRALTKIVKHVGKANLSTVLGDTILDDEEEESEESTPEKVA